MFVSGVNLGRTDPPPPRAKEEKKSLAKYSFIGSLSCQLKLSPNSLGLQHCRIALLRGGKKKRERKREKRKKRGKEREREKGGRTVEEEVSCDPQSKEVENVEIFARYSRGGKLCCREEGADFHVESCSSFPFESTLTYIQCNDFNC